MSDKICTFRDAGAPGGACQAQECPALRSGHCSLPPHIVKALKDRPVIRRGRPDLTDVKALEDRVMAVLLECGVRMDLQGSVYLRECIMAGILEPDLLTKLFQKLYPVVAEKFDTDAKHLDRSVRHAVDVLFQTEPTEMTKAIFPCIRNGVKTRVTNGWFICGVADAIARGVV